ncbi:MAG TPA: hypothetical protein ENN77_01185 [Candidatus Wirthbacteria bacterium]|nr:hypothetical protein [Candidatus Wirthbacteria bacterium]
MSYDLQEALDEAIKMEIKIRDFYLDAIPKLESELARDVLKFLAEQEIIHIENIQRFQSTALGQEVGFDLGERIINTTRKKAKTFFAKRKKQFEQMINGSAQDADIYKLGLKIEKNGYEYYQQQAQATQDADAKKLFEFLVLEETTHYDLLEKLSRYFLEPGFWFLEEEQWLFEG